MEATKLLVCVDGSMPYMESCLQYAEWIIKAMNATADILYVTDAHQFDFAMMGDFSGALGAQPYQRLCDQLKQIETEKTRVVKETVEKFFEKAGLSDKITFKHERGSLVDSCQAYEHSEVGGTRFVGGQLPSIRAQRSRRGFDFNGKARRKCGVCDGTPRCQFGACGTCQFKALFYCLPKIYAD